MTAAMIAIPAMSKSATRGTAMSKIVSRINSRITGERRETGGA